ncbi:hypothetical protein Acr_03g0004340 [Actinidia rufa]|uniref:Uncharacterized protein n=1 Tax=Actinidia rufa TaxID=165716 RepID=A0A7J0EB96_9ERIC|nr:hypothetical protein Acr_03g0004340 [Actinidia rufa]
MSPHQARSRVRSLMEARGARTAHGACENCDDGDNDNHHESVMGGEANAFGGNIWIVGGAPPTVISDISGRADLFWLSPIGTSCCGLPTEGLEEAVETGGILPRAGAGVVTEEEHPESFGTTSFGAEGSEDLGTGLCYDISSRTIKDNGTAGAIVGCLCCTRYFPYV